MSIKNKIYSSFFILVFLFLVNGVACIIMLNNNRKLSAHISTITDPSLEAVENFQKMLLESKMYTTNWFFSSLKEEEVNALKKLQTIDYPALKTQLTILSAQWYDKGGADTLRLVFAGFEQLITEEKKVMTLLAQPADYKDPRKKAEAEQIVEDELVPRTTSLMNTLKLIENTGRTVRKERNLRVASRTHRGSVEFY